VTIPASVLEIVSTSVEQTQELGARLGKIVQAGDVIALQGDLGAGKTNFVQGLARGLGITEDVNSPTFILANEYLSGRLALYHIDAYRVQDAAEAKGFGLDDYLYGDGVTVVEWAERVRAALPRDVLWIRFAYRDETTRALFVTAVGPSSARLLRNGFPDLQENLTV
jgi:tRNA threonylcarbamoyladenosine biosynthesis protein TsaE